MKRLLILGLGNDILSDDAIGLRLTERLREELAGHAEIECRATTEMGLALLDYIGGYEAVFILDSIQTGKALPGFLHELDPGSLNRLVGSTPHFLGVGETLALGRQLGLEMPKQVKVFAVEVQDPFTLGTRMTPVLEAALERLTRRIASAAIIVAEAQPQPALCVDQAPGGLRPV
jgi:hydrogenase maturation protease